VQHLHRCLPFPHRMGDPAAVDDHVTIAHRMNLVVIAINEVALGELEEPTIETISEPDAIGEEQTLRILIKVTSSRS
jgi:hypothetical protein